MAESEAPIRTLLVAGARPNFMKVAPLLREFRKRPGFRPCLVHTGQHYDARMSEAFFRDLGLPEPDVHLGVGSGSHAAQTAGVLAAIEPVLLDFRPHVTVVVGDVNSTLAAALASVKIGIPVAHVEAGLRSFDPTMPEEINRVLTDRISRWLFTTEPSGEENLLREGVPRERIHFVGNVMIDTLRAHVDRARQRDIRSPLGIPDGPYGVLTLHRPANVDDPERLRTLFAALEKLHRDCPLVFPVHPRTRGVIERQLGGRPPRLLVCEPLGYLDFLALLAGACLVLTDSGGIQEETTVLGVPCLTLRNNTERPVTLTHGTNRLVGADPDAILRVAREALAPAEAGWRTGPAAPDAGRAGGGPPLWDGRAAGRIVEVLEREARQPGAVA